MGVIAETLERPSQRFWERGKKEPVIKRTGVTFQDGKATVKDSVLGDIEVEDFSPAILVTVTVRDKQIEVYNASDRLIQEVTDNEKHSFLIGPKIDHFLTLKTKNGKREVTLKIEEDTPPPQELAGVPAKLNSPPSPLRAGAALKIPRES